MPEGNEEKSFTPKSEETLKEEIITEFDFDEEQDAERISKLLVQRIEHQKELSIAIEQKIRQRSKAESLEKRLKDAGVDPETGDRIGQSKSAGSEMSSDSIASLRREIDDLKMGMAGDFPEEIRKEVEQLAKLNGISYKDASKSEYIKFRMEQHKSKERAEAGSLDGGRGASMSGSKLEKVAPEEFGKLSDDDWAKKKELIKQGKG